MLSIRDLLNADSVSPHSNTSSPPLDPAPIQPSFILPPPYHHHQQHNNHQQQYLHPPLHPQPNPSYYRSNHLNSYPPQHRYNNNHIHNHDHHYQNQTPPLFTNNRPPSQHPYRYPASSSSKREPRRELVSVSAFVSEENGNGKGRMPTKILKGPWRPAETALLSQLVEEHGPQRWADIASHIPGRTGKQARERWKNHLDPRLKKGNWTPEEDKLIIDEYKRRGNKWSKIATLLKGRSDNDVKNRFNGTLSNKINKHKRGASASRTAYKNEPQHHYEGGSALQPQHHRNNHGELLEVGDQPPTMFNIYP